MGCWPLHALKKKKHPKGGGDDFDLIYIGIKNGSGLTWRCFVGCWQVHALKNKKKLKGGGDGFDLIYTEINRGVKKNRKTV